jgi:hypothetical protein
LHLFLLYASSWICHTEYIYIYIWIYMYLNIQSNKFHCNISYMHIICLDHSHLPFFFFYPLFFSSWSLSPSLIVLWMFSIAFPSLNPIFWYAGNTCIECLTLKFLRDFGWKYFHICQADRLETDHLNPVCYWSCFNLCFSIYEG